MRYTQSYKEKMVKRMRQAGDQTWSAGHQLEEASTVERSDGTNLADTHSYDYSVAVLANKRVRYSWRKETAIASTRKDRKASSAFLTTPD